MGLSRNRRSEQRADYWPGFVDAMATLLLVLIFLLTVFMVAQFFLSQEISGKDTALNELNSQIAELTELLALERANGQDMESSIATLQASLSSAEAARDRFAMQLETQKGDQDSAGGQIATLTNQLESEKAISQRALAQVELLNQQISASAPPNRGSGRRFGGPLRPATGKVKPRSPALANRLNIALAQRVQELSRYRSDFFGRFAGNPFPALRHPRRRRPLRLPVRSALLLWRRSHESGRRAGTRPCGRGPPGTDSGYSGRDRLGVACRRSYG